MSVACTATHLAHACVRWEVEVGALSYMARSHKLAPLFRLTFRRSSLQHPLLAGALGGCCCAAAACCCCFLGQGVQARGAAPCFCMFSYLDGVWFLICHSWYIVLYALCQTVCRRTVPVHHPHTPILSYLLPTLLPWMDSSLISLLSMKLSVRTLPGRIAEDRAACELIAKEEVAIQQLVLMALSENGVVVRQACKTLGAWLWGCVFGWSFVPVVVVVWVVVVYAVAGLST